MEVKDGLLFFFLIMINVKKKKKTETKRKPNVINVQEKVKKKPKIIVEKNFQKKRRVFFLSCAIQLFGCLLNFFFVIEYFKNKQWPRTELIAVFLFCFTAAAAAAAAAVDTGGSYVNQEGTGQRNFWKFDFLLMTKKIIFVIFCLLKIRITDNNIILTKKERKNRIAHSFFCCLQ